MKSTTRSKIYAGFEFNTELLQEKIAETKDTTERVKEEREKEVTNHIKSH